tara:strand:- start:375 stop:1484 length:1110 start_codon:yes stop_codon:yes gene_type:complete
VFVTRFSASCLRGFNFIELAPSNSINIILGKNNAGKTTIIEGLHFCSTLRSFKNLKSETLIQFDKSMSKIQLNVTKFDENNTIYVENTLTSSKISKLNTKRAGSKTLMAFFPTIALSFGTENVINSQSDVRRSLLDWGTFHVEPDYLLTLKSYLKVLKNRNLAIKQRDFQSIDTWSKKLSSLGEEIDIKRKSYFDILQKSYISNIEKIKANNLIHYNDILLSNISYSRGWPLGSTLSEALSDTQEKDLALKYTSVGPHKADIIFKTGSDTLKNLASMSTQVIISLLLILAQSEVFHVKQGYRPILLIDDLFFGIDDNNLGLVINLLSETRSQCFITAPDLYFEKISMFRDSAKNMKIYKLEDDNTIGEV